jgi:hypothetical protein
MGLVAVALGCLTVVLSTAAPAVAQFNRVGSPLQIYNASSGEIHPDVAYDDKNGYYLVVFGDGSNTSRRPAFAQLVSAGGAMVGARLELTNCVGEMYGQRPRVLYSKGSTDDVFLAFYREVCGTGKVYAHLLRSSASGVVSLGRVLVDSGGTSGSLAYNPQLKEFFVVWERIVGSFNVYGRAIRMTRSGSEVTGLAALPGIVTVSAHGLTEGLPDIAYDPASESYFIVFQGENPSSGLSAIMAKTMDGASYALSPLIIVNQGGNQVQPAVTLLPGPQQFMVAWRHAGDIVARRYAPVSGAAASGIYPVIALPGTDGAAALAFDTESGVGLVAGMQSDYWVWGSKFSSTGALINTFRASGAPPTPPGGGTFFPQIVGTGTGTLAMTYGVDYKKVYFERFTDDGSTGGGTPPPPPPPPPGTINLSALTASPAPPVSTGTPITWTGVASGGTIEYQFHLYNGNTNAWTMTRNWATGSTWQWTPTAAGEYAVQVWARLQGQTSFQYKSSGYFSVTGSAAPPAGSLTLNSLVASPTLPRPANTLITWTGNATVGGGGTAEYQFHLYNGNTKAWTMVRNWASGNTWEWTPTAAGTYAVQVWARLQGATAFQYKSSGYFNVTQPVGPTPTLTLTGIGADPVPPMVGTGTTVTWAGIANVGGGGTAEYQFWLYTGSTNSWAMTRNWGPGNTWQWTPAAAGTYAVQVWARLVGQTAFQYGASGYFTVTTTPADTPLVNISSVTSTPSTFTAGQPVGWAATASGPGALQYSYWVYRQSTDTWTNVRPYAASGAYTWTPPAAGTYAVQVWVRRSGQTIAYEDYHATGYFTVN